MSMWPDVSRMFHSMVLVDIQDNPSPERHPLMLVNFEDKLRQREMQGRSASMMQTEMRLPWGSTLLSPQSAETHQFIKAAREQDLGQGMEP